MLKNQDQSIRISKENYDWLLKKSEATQISIKSIVDLAIKRLRGDPDTALSLLFKENKK